MRLIFSPPALSDLNTMMVIEHSGFTPEEAASKEAMADRIKYISDSFITARNGNTVLGYIVGPIIKERYISDELFDITIPNPPNHSYQSILSLVVHPDYQGKGIAGQLLNELIDQSRTRGLKGITLTCRENLIAYYERYGFINEGVSNSSHAGLTWYNLVYEL